MDIDDLRMLNVVARHGSMNRAAAELHTVQSNVTARVRQLEDELGVPLFVRHSRGVRLSDAGQRLLAYHGQIDALLREAVASVKEDGVPKGALRIGALEQTVSLRLAPVLARYTARYPAVALTLTTGNSDGLMQQVSEETLDGAFVLGPVERDDLRGELMFRDRLTLLSGPLTGSMDALRAARDVKALVRAEGCSYQGLLARILEAQNIQYQPMALGSTDALRSLVEANVGVTLVPEGMLGAGVWKSAHVVAHPLPEALAQVATVFVSKGDRPVASALQAFVSLCRDVAEVGV